MLPWGLAIVWAAAAGPAAAPPAAPPAGSRSFPRLFRGLAPVPAASPCGFPAGCSHPLPLSLLHFCNTQSHVYSPFNHRDFWIFCSLFFSSSFLSFFFNIINYNLIWKFPIDGFDFFFFHFKFLLFHSIIQCRVEMFQIRGKNGRTPIQSARLNAQ